MATLTFHAFLPPNSPQNRHLASRISSFPPRFKCPLSRFRCSIPKESTISPVKVDAGDISNGDSVDCVCRWCWNQRPLHRPSTNKLPGKVIVTEARDRVGGNITMVEKDGYLWEEGPNSFQRSDSILSTVVECGLKDELVLGDPNAPRFVLWDGKLRPVPSKPFDFPFFDLMSFSGKLRAGFGAIGIRPPPPVTGS